MEPYPEPDRSPLRPGCTGRRSAQGGVGWVLFIGVVTAVSGLAVESDRGVFRVRVHAAKEPDAGWTTNWVWTVSTNRFRIAPIPGWNLKVNRGERRLEVYNPDRTSLITLRHSVLTNAPSQQQIRQTVSERHEDFRILGEETLHSGCGSAVVFDLLFAEEGKRALPSMAAWKAAMIATEGGLIECTLRTSVRSQPELLRTFNRFLVGLRLLPPDEGGRVP